MTTNDETKSKKWQEKSFEELVAQARVYVEETGLDDNGYWEIIQVLVKRENRETLEKTLHLTASQDECERDFAVSVLGRMGEV